MNSSKALDVDMAQLTVSEKAATGLPHVATALAVGASSGGPAGLAYSDMHTMKDSRCGRPKSMAS